MSEGGKVGGWEASVCVSWELVAITTTPLSSRGKPSGRFIGQHSLNYSLEQLFKKQVNSVLVSLLEDSRVRDSVRELHQLCKG